MHRLTSIFDSNMQMVLCSVNGTTSLVCMRWRGRREPYTWQRDGWEHWKTVHKKERGKMKTPVDPRGDLLTLFLMISVLKKWTMPSWSDNINSKPL